MIERHPHVFGQEEQRSQTHHSEAWENQKTLERKQKNKGKLWHFGRSGPGTSCTDEV